VFDVEDMMGPLSQSEYEELSHWYKSAKYHWRVIAAKRVCEGCPLSIFNRCQELNPQTPGIRAGVYMSIGDSERDVSRY
jgi:hypothetical protein